MAAPPRWATALLELVCAEHTLTPPRLTWRRGHRMRSRAFKGLPEFRPMLASGRYTCPPEHRIVVTAGSSRQDAKLVLLHELAHALTPGQHHSEQFWVVAWRLYRRHGVPIRYAQSREYRYRKGARAGYLAVRRGVVATPAAPAAAATIAASTPAGRGRRASSGPGLPRSARRSWSEAPDVPQGRRVPEAGLFLRVLPDGDGGLLSRDAFAWLLERSPGRRFAWDVDEPTGDIAIRPSPLGGMAVTSWRRLRVHRVAAHLAGPGRYQLRIEEDGAGGGRLVVVKPAAAGDPA